MTAEFEELAYTVAERNLQRQVELLREIRSRTGALLAAASLAVSFLGGEAFAAVDTAFETVLAAGALGAFAVSVAASGYVLMPNDDISLPPAASILREALFPFREQMGEVYRRLTYELDDTRTSNKAALRRASRAFRTAGVTLAAAEVSLLLLVVGGTLV